MPDTPGLFSMMTDWPSRAPSCSASRRATPSLTPPGENGTMYWMFLAGQAWASWAWAGAEHSRAAAAARVPRKKLRIDVSPMDEWQAGCRPRLRCLWLGRWLGSGSMRRPDGGALDQVAGHDDVARAQFGLHLFAQQRHGGIHHGLDALAHRGQAVRAPGGLRHVVETDHRHVLRHARAEFLAQHVQCRDGHVVVGGEEGIRRVAAEQAAHRRLRLVEVVVPDFAPVQFVAGLAQCRAVAAFALDAGGGVLQPRQIGKATVAA